MVPNIYVTELDLSTKDDALQLKLRQTYWPLFWERSNVKGITIWDWVVTHVPFPKPGENHCRGSKFALSCVAQRRWAR